MSYLLSTSIIVECGQCLESCVYDVIERDVFVHIKLAHSGIQLVLHPVLEHVVDFA